MDFEVIIENEDQFWDELDDIVCTPCRSSDRIDDTLRTWLGFTAKYRGSQLPTPARMLDRTCPSPKLIDEEQYLQSDHLLSRCSRKLLESALYSKHSQYVRLQIVYVLLQEDDPHTLHLIALFLLFDGRQEERTYELMNAEGVFIRLVQLARAGVDDGLELHRLLLELLYEMSRIQRISQNDLAIVDDIFIVYLFQIIEGLSNDVNDPYHYPTIRVLLVLNEQYMVAAHDPSANGAGATIQNRIIKALSVHGRIYKTFGESIILLLNRESETSLQLLILKLLYLLFTTPFTHEYFYTNDLYVLIDILIRNLLDLPADASHPSAVPLRHTYLRVLHPLLANTQLRNPPHYKAEELRRCLWLLLGGGYGGHGHFAGPDETTVRLVGRCKTVDWLKDEENTAPDSSTVDPGGGGVEEVSLHGGESVKSTKAVWPVRDQVVVSKIILGMGLPEARESNLSVMEIAAHTERPGVLTPSRERDGNGHGSASLTAVARDNGLSEHGTAPWTSDKSPFDEEIED